MVLWLRPCLPMQGMWIWSLVREERSHVPCNVATFFFKLIKTKKQGRLKDSRFFDEATHVSQNHGAGQITVLIKIKGIWGFWDDQVTSSVTLEGFVTHTSKNKDDKRERGKNGILAWETPWTEKPGGLQSTGLQRVRHDCSNLARMRVFITESSQVFITESFCCNPETTVNIVNKVCFSKNCRKA